MGRALRAELEALDRESLIARAEAGGIRRARILTRPEIIDELLRRDPTADAATLKRTRGFFGVARDLLARVVERGLHLPDAADRIRTIGDEAPPPRVDFEVVPTVTLAEIYAAQGHKERAVATLESVLEREPDHASARALHAKLSDSEYVPPPPPLPPEPEGDAAIAAPMEDEESAPVVSEAVVASASSSPTLPGPRRAPKRASCIVVPASARSWLVTWDGLDGGGDLPGPFFVRIAVVEPTWDGPRVTTRDLAASPSSGVLYVERIPARAILRATVGYGRDDAFVPVATADLLEAASTSSGAGLGLVRFGLDEPLSIDEGDPAFAAVARAVGRARELSRG